jgi:DNA-binding response OmpR family regulator
LGSRSWCSRCSAGSSSRGFSRRCHSDLPLESVKAILLIRAPRRRGQPDGDEEQAIVHGALRLEPASHRATLNGTDLALTPKEFELLHLLAANPGRAVNREFLIERIWGGDFGGFDRAVDNHIRRLRQKLGDFGEKIATVWGVGYRFVV